jgi:hypothetical protein
MRAGVRAVVLILVLLVAAPLQSAAARKPSGPVVLDLKWRSVGNGAQYLAASDRYAALLHYATPAGTAGLTLIDEQTGRRRHLAPPACVGPDGSWYPMMFGGPWLIVDCGQQPPMNLPTYSLYNVASGQWSAFSVSAQCHGNCHVVALGRYWVKILTDEGMVTYGPDDYYLQNISTGQLERDPATPGGTVFDDLNLASGSRALCSPLRYPSVLADHSDSVRYPGSLSFYGPFALASGSDGSRLHRCGSRLNQVLPASYNPNSQPAASSRAVIVSPDGATLDGWYLPTLQRFVVRDLVAVDNVAVTDRSIYVQAGDQVHAAALPAAFPVSRR